MIIRRTTFSKALSLAILITNNNNHGGFSFVSGQETPAPTSSPTNSPTNAPTTSSPTISNGCPPLWVEGATTYSAGTLVSQLDSTTPPEIRQVYECRSELYRDLFCPLAGFEPGTTYTDYAWIKRGNCNSLLDYQIPTSSPTGVPSSSPTWSLWDKIGCPDAFDQTLGTQYFAGDTVEYNNLVYNCTTNDRRCHQSGYEPYGALGYENWEVLGRCVGTSE